LAWPLSPLYKVGTSPFLPFPPAHSPPPYTRGTMILFFCRKIVVFSRHPPFFFPHFFFPPSLNWPGLASHLFSFESCFSPPPPQATLRYKTFLCYSALFPFFLDVPPLFTFWPTGSLFFPPAMQDYSFPWFDPARPPFPFLFFNFFFFFLPESIRIEFLARHRLVLFFFLSPPIDALFFSSRALSSLPELRSSAFSFFRPFSPRRSPFFSCLRAGVSAICPCGFFFSSTATPPFFSHEAPPIIRKYLSSYFSRREAQLLILLPRIIMPFWLRIVEVAFYPFPLPFFPRLEDPLFPFLSISRLFSVLFDIFSLPPPHAGYKVSSFFFLNFRRSSRRLRFFFFPSEIRGPLFGSAILFLAVSADPLLNVSGCFFPSPCKSQAVRQDPHYQKPIPPPPREGPSFLLPPRGGCCWAPSEPPFFSTAKWYIPLFFVMAKLLKRTAPFFLFREEFLSFLSPLPTHLGLSTTFIPSTIRGQHPFLFLS